MIYNNVNILKSFLEDNKDLIEEGHLIQLLSGQLSYIVSNSNKFSLPPGERVSAIKELKQDVVRLLIEMEKKKLYTPDYYIIYFSNGWGGSWNLLTTKYPYPGYLKETLKFKTKKEAQEYINQQSDLKSNYKVIGILGLKD